MAFPRQSVVGGTIYVDGQPLMGNYVINGIPFSGTGFGFNGNGSPASDSDGIPYGLHQPELRQHHLWTARLLGYLS